MPDTNEIMTMLAVALSTWGLKILAGLAILILGRLVAGLVRKGVRRTLSRTQFDPTLTPFIANLVYAVLMVGILYGAASAVGIPMTGFVAIIGAAGLAVALAFQGTLSNFSSGVMLLTFRPFKVGDFVDAAGVAGNIKEIGVFTTTMATPDNVRIIIPNSAIAGATIKNFSANEDRRVDLVVGVSYDDDLNLAMDVINRVIGADSRVLAEPEPVVAVDNMGASSVDFVVRPWVKAGDYWPVKWALTKALKEELEAAGCSIPYPQRDVHLYQAG
ncbi:MAG TPA: mechanosensitive ion channel domain-containing protein [Longimicrobiales bacterium]|nr:mechanosensitive ion channel domain-containing protein [Longimicrobiales bacterium]